MIDTRPKDPRLCCGIRAFLFTLNRSFLTWLSLCALWMIPASVSHGAQEPGGLTMAVIPLESHGEDIGGIATAELREQIGKTHRFRLVEEERVADVLHRIAESHQRDYDNALEAGKLLAARYVCYGSVESWVAEKRLEYHTRLMAYVRLAIRVVEVETGEITFDENTTQTEVGWQNEAPIEVLHTSAAARAIEELVRRFGNTFRLEGVVIQVEGNRVLIDLGLEHGLKKGMKLDLFRRGGRILHPDTGEPIAVPDIDLGEVKLEDVGERSSWAKVKGKDVRVGDRVRTRTKDKSSWEW